MGQDGEKWVSYLDRYSLEVQELMKLPAINVAFINKVYGRQPLLSLVPRPLSHPLSFQSLIVSFYKRYQTRIEARVFLTLTHAKIKRYSRHNS
jgi:hypothetical protein